MRRAGSAAPVLSSLLALGGVWLGACGAHVEPTPGDAGSGAVDLPAAPAGNPARRRALMGRAEEPAPAPLVVGVATRSLEGDPAPHRAFELLRLEPEGEPWLPEAPEVLATGWTGADGTASVELRGLEVASGEQPPLCARLIEPGCQQRLAPLHPLAPSESWPCVDGGSWVAELVASPGATARGRVVDAAGEPVDARVSLHEWTERGGRRWLRTRAVARGTGAGRFELDLEAGAEDGELVLLADGDASGSASLRAVALPLDDPPQELRLELCGEGVVRGRVTDREGEPVAGLALLVLHAGLEAGDGPLALREPLASERRAEGGGRAWVQLRTRRDGAFEARGLRAGDEYAVRAQILRGDAPYALRLASAVAGDGEAAALELSVGLPELAVRLLEEGGTARTGEWPRSVSDRWSSIDAPSDWPRLPVVRAYRQAEGVDEPLAAGDPIVGRAVAADLYVLESLAPGRYLVGAVGGGYDGAMRLVELAPDEPRHEVELRASDARPTSAVRVRVLHAGEELAGGAKLDVYLEEVDSAAVLVAADTYVARSPFLLRAPPGRYRVVAEGRYLSEPRHGIPGDRRELGRAEREVELRRGEVVEVALELEEGARVALTLEGEPAPEDELAAEPRWSALDVRVELRAPGRRPIEVLRVADEPPRASGHPRLTGRFELGLTFETEVLPTGSCELVARTMSGREVRATVELASGEALPVTLRFD